MRKSKRIRICAIKNVTRLNHTWFLSFYSFVLVSWSGEHSSFLRDYLGIVPKWRNHHPLPEVVQIFQIILLNIYMLQSNREHLKINTSPRLIWRRPEPSLVLSVWIKVPQRWLFVPSLSQLLANDPSIISDTQSADKWRDLDEIKDNCNISLIDRPPPIFAPHVEH